VVQAPGRPWRSVTLERSTIAPKAPGYTSVTPRAIALSDSSGSTYATWNGIAHGAPAVRFATIGARKSESLVQPILTLSAPGGVAALNDATAGPRDALLVCWSTLDARHMHASVYAAVRRAGGPFAAAVRLTQTAIPGNAVTAGFEPLSGAALVVSRVLENNTIELQAARAP
jgi:hypothetical protein